MVRNRLAEGVGLIAGVAALAMGGVAAGLELERRLISKRIDRTSQARLEQFFALRSSGPAVTTADGVVLHTEVDEGPADDFTVLWVHGYALNLDNWHFQRQHFRGRVRQVFYDQRSHGRSTRSDREHCRLDQLALDLLQVLDEVVGPGPVVVIGHSMGGMTIMRLAQSRPDLFGTRIVGVGLLHTSAGELAQHSPIRGLPGRTFSRVAPPLMAFASDVPPSYVEYVSEMLGQTPLEVVADFYPAFGELDEYESLAGLSKLPVVVIGGEDDLFTPVEHTDRITELLPDAVALRLEHCGHLGMIEHAGPVNEVLDDLLDRVRAAGGPPRRATGSSPRPRRR